MKARNYAREQIIAVLKEGKTGAKAADSCCKYAMMTIRAKGYESWHTSGSVSAAPEFIWDL